MYIFLLVTYDGTELGSTDGTADGKFEVLLLGASLGSIDGLEVGCTEGNKLCLSNERVLGTTLDTYDGTELRLSLCSSTAHWKFDVALDELVLVSNEGSKLGFRACRVLDTKHISMY